MDTPSGVSHLALFEGEGAIPDPMLCEALGVSKQTIRRYRKLHGMPPPDFFVGQSGYTEKLKLRLWCNSLPKRSPLAGRTVRQDSAAA